jgi:hypothetical protein
LHDEHVHGGLPHDLSWNGAEFITLRRAESAVPDHNKTPVIGAGRVQEDFRWVTGKTHDLITAHAQLIHHGVGTLPDTYIRWHIIAGSSNVIKGQ